MKSLNEKISGCDNINQADISEWENGEESELDFNYQNIVDMALPQPWDINKAAGDEDNDADSSSYDINNEVFNALEFLSWIGSRIRL